jgi:hypothetical protein
MYLECGVDDLYSTNPNRVANLSGKELGGRKQYGKTNNYRDSKNRTKESTNNLSPRRKKRYFNSRNKRK